MISNQPSLVLILPSITHSFDMKILWTLVILPKCDENKGIFRDSWNRFPDPLPEERSPTVSVMKSIRQSTVSHFRVAGQLGAIRWSFGVRFNSDGTAGSSPKKSFHKKGGFNSFQPAVLFIPHVRPVYSRHPKHDRGTDEKTFLMLPCWKETSTGDNVCKTRVSVICRRYSIENYLSVNDPALTKSFGKLWAFVNLLMENCCVIRHNFRPVRQFAEPPPSVRQPRPKVLDPRFVTRKLIDAPTCHCQYDCKTNFPLTIGEPLVPMGARSSTISLLGRMNFEVVRLPRQDAVSSGPMDGQVDIK